MLLVRWLIIPTPPNAVPFSELLYTSPYPVRLLHSVVWPHVHGCYASPQTRAYP